MAFNVDEDRVRAKNKDLLLTDKISTTEVDQAILDSKRTFLARIYEGFDTSITDTQFNDTMNLGVLLITCATLIFDNYSDQEQALKVAENYNKQATDLIKSIIKGKELAKTEGVSRLDRVTVKRTNIDNTSNTFSDQIKDYYR